MIFFKIKKKNIFLTHFPELFDSFLSNELIKLKKSTKLIKKNDEKINKERKNSNMHNPVREREVVDERNKLYFNYTLENAVNIAS